jgi:ferrous iron transport protein A
MKLTEGRKGGKYIIESISAKKETESRLEALGLIQGSYVEIINKKRSGSMIIRLRGTRFALGRDIAEGIAVGTEVKNNG